MKIENQVTLEFPSRSANEGFARTAAACFAAQLDPTLEEVNDIKTAVSEAVTNAIVHAYPDTLGRVSVKRPGDHRQGLGGWHRRRGPGPDPPLYHRQ